MRYSWHNHDRNVTLIEAVEINVGVHVVRELQIHNLGQAYFVNFDGQVLFLLHAILLAFCLGAEAVRQKLFNVE